MRRSLHASLIALASASVLASCATTDAPQARSAQAEREIAKLLGERVAGKAQTCLPTYRSQDMVVIDENTILFRDGRRFWRSEMSGCSGLGRPGTALLTRQFGSNSLCSNEIAQVIDTSHGMTVGSCSFGDFVPYDPVRSR